VDARRRIDVKIKIVQGGSAVAKHGSEARGSEGSKKVRYRGVVGFGIVKMEV
jgi:hypothetical protein